MATVLPADAARNPKKPKQKREHWLLREFPQLRAPKPEPPETVGPSLRHQNEVADRYNLPRIQNSEELAVLKTSGYLVRAKTHYSCFKVDQKLSRKAFKVPIAGSKKKKKTVENFRYLNSTAELGVKRLAEEYCENDTVRGGKPLVISSLVRTQEYQKFLCRRKRNLNACEAIGDTSEDRSLHLTGYAFDISALGHSRKELRELARILVRDKEAGSLTEVIFEPGQNHFHIMVHP